MVRDYSEKRGGRDSSVERRPVAKNRPRREGGGLVFFAALLVIALAYAAGVGTGWFFFKHKAAAAVAVVQPAKKPEPQQAPPPQPPQDPQLTFYKTLPAGGNGVMGTGLNLKKPEPHPPASRQAAVPAAPPAAAPAQAPGASPAPQGAPAEQGEAENQAHFLVQVASYRDKQEAVTAQSKLSAKGLPAYLVELKDSDKGTWYRLRVGRHLTKAEAGDMASKCGKGALVLPE